MSSYFPNTLSIQKVWQQMKTRALTMSSYSSNQRTTCGSWFSSPGGGGGSWDGTILSHLAETIFPILFEQMCRPMKPLFMTKVNPNCLFSSIMQQRLICSMILDIDFYWSSCILDFWNILWKFQCLLLKCCHFKALILTLNFSYNSIDPWYHSEFLYIFAN